MSLLAAVVLAAASPAQATWGTPFNHETITSGPTVPNPNATDHLIPFGGYSNANITYFSYGPTYDWQQRLNSVHMALIPKGQHRGKVLVWGSTAASGYVNVGTPVLVRAPGLNPPLQPNEYWSCAAWSIVDPADVPVGPRFRNFLLPLERFTPPNPLPPPGDMRAPSLFCAGHVWSPYGDLVVAGGTYFGIPTLLGAKLTFAFNPKLATRGWPVSGFGATPLYPGELGLWEPGPDLVFSRFYPTLTLTHRLARLANPSHAQGREVAFTSGGSVDNDIDDPAINVTWNNYEALVIDTAFGPATLFNSRLSADTIGTVNFWPGPGTPAVPPNPPPVEEDWLEDYPRFHLLSTGKLFFSGYAPRWAQVDHDAAPGIWTRQAAPPWSSTTWQFPRHDGTSLLFPNVGGLKDLVVRLGGADEVNYAPAPNGTTSTIEAFVAQGAGGFWTNAGNLPNTLPGVLPNGRYLMNIVILPDASLLVLGGVARLPNGPKEFVYHPLLYKNGAWTVLTDNVATSKRDYHASAVLLPDGRVFVGGGNEREVDYEIFSPAYMTLPKPQNVVFQTSVTFDPVTDAYMLGYGSEYQIGFNTLPIGEYIEKVVLIAPGAATHHQDMHQRYVGMEITGLDGDHTISSAVRFITPPDEKHAPRGIYMLFLVTTAGAVADATWVVMR